tara:strand:+ start:222 stop:593 length:372 start_codon:yes stop_codon:yes gene_type:complete
MVQHTFQPKPNTERQTMFLEGAKNLVLNHHPFPNREQTLLIILFTGIFDDDVERCKWAMDHGAVADMEIQPWAIGIMRAVGWDCSELDSYVTVLSTDAPEESEQTLPQYDEPGPDSGASQEAI